MSELVKPHIGKNVIETLTLGMYENPMFIFREYVQNAADQIDVAVDEGILSRRDEGKIDIKINAIERTIEITDNATGINESSVLKFLSDVANSEKDVTKRKGFRGIGRLGGLGYCDKLIFETSSKGEAVKSILTLNAKFLKEILSDIKDSRDAASVITAITQTAHSKAEKNSHYFKVTLENVSTDELLNEDKIIEYLSLVAPVAFSPEWSYTSKIKAHFKRRNIVFDEYNVEVNTNKIYKAYKDVLHFTKGDGVDGVITTIGFFDVKDKNSVRLAVGWYGISNKLNYVIEKDANPERGIRIRKSNIAIGDEKTLFPRFKSERTNLRYIGEIHVNDNGFIPNARRDYFNLNNTVKQFEESLNKIFSDFESKLPHVASNLHTRIATIRETRNLITRYKEDAKKFKTNEEREQRFQEVQASVKKSNQATKTIQKIENDSVTNSTIKDLFDSIVNGYEYKISDSEFNGIYNDRVIPPLKFSKVTPSQATILNEVVIFLQKELSHRTAAPLIEKLQKKYN